ncbi:Gfo/Idh/MocA family protein [Paenibacillus baimaensis]|nr:Gfo/Idh/MocA family oxidoreductase [Paenibacillus sp. WQ 127069]
MVSSAISINSTTKELSGGGSLIDLGVHFIDLAVWLMGNPKPVAVTGATYTKFANNEISNSVHSRFGEKKENGASLQIEFSRASNILEDANFVKLRGTKAGSNLRIGVLQLYSEAAGQLTNVTLS